MNDDKIDPKLRTILSKLPANTVKIEDPRYEIFYPNINGYCDGIGYYRSYMYNGASIDTFNDEKIQSGMKSMTTIRIAHKLCAADIS